MKIFTLVLIATCLAGVLSLPTNQKFKSKKNLELRPLENILASLAHPDIAGSGRNSILKDYNGLIELLQIDLPTMFLELAGLVGDSIRVPDFHAEYYIELCPSFCVDFTEIWEFSNTTIEGASDVALNTSMSGRRLQLDFQIPDVHIRSPGFLYDSTSVFLGTHSVMKGLNLNVTNYTIQFSADLLLGSEGLRVNNTGFLLDVGKILARVENDTSTDRNGNVTERGPQEYNFSEVIRENIWTDEVEQGFGRILETWLNCFLSNGSISPGECENYVNDKFHKQSFAQLIHAVGLGQMLGGERSFFLNQAN